MIKEALKYLMGLSVKPDERFVDVVDDDGNKRIYTVNEEGRVSEIKPSVNRAKNHLNVNTLTGLIDYIKSNLERADKHLLLQVYDEKIVLLKGLLDVDGGREELVIAGAIIPDFQFDYFHETEELIIALQSKFVANEDRNKLLQVVGNIKEENVRNTGDNGFSQAVTVKTGVTSVDDILVPNPVRLAPYRTFLEVEQPESDFIFRMKDGPRGAIFEADGGAWRNQAIDNIREYLKKELSEEIENGRITIIA